MHSSSADNKRTLGSSYQSITVLKGAGVGRGLGIEGELNYYSLHEVFGRPVHAYFD